MLLQDWSEYGRVCAAAAQAGGAELERWREHFTTQSKGRNDFVTDADFASQRIVHDRIADHFPDHGFVGEEQIDLPLCANTGSPFQWIVDPLDGTMNYVHQLQSWSVSVALRYEGRIVAGAVYDPWLKELYTAVADGPACLNGKPIRVSDCSHPSEALVIISMPPRLTPQTPEIASLINLLCSARSIRRLGSAALNLCYVAAGRTDAYWATTLNLWDLAAGWLIVERAGGVVVSPDGGPFSAERPRLLAASSQELATGLQTILAASSASP